MFLFQININAASDSMSITPSIIFENSSDSYPIDLIDTEREEEKIIVYTKNYGEFTGPFGTNTHEYVIVNNIVVHENTMGANGTYIPPNGCIISYTGNDEAFIQRFAVGISLTLSNIDIPISPNMYFVLDDMLIPIDQVNTGRDANQTVLYNTAYGTRTKTNQWGMELTIVNDTITKIADMTNDTTIQGENNSQIPSDGVVISIHVGSPSYMQVHEKAKQGANIKVVADSKLYNASKIKYAAYNPRTIADNPAAWDIEEGKPYDSFRGPEQLIIYDSSYGEFTGTNPYGYEVTVNSEGKITSTGGNDSNIPKGGYILSGHGESLKWLQKHALLGSTVVLSTDKKEVTIILTPASYVNRALFSIKSAQDRLDLARLQYWDISYDNVQQAIDLAAAKLVTLNAQLEEEQYEDLINTVKEIQQDADNAYFMTFESFKVENRAVWLRPKDTGIEDIKKRFDMLESININTIYLETYWNGYAIYPTGNELMRHNPVFNGFDVLDSYIKEAHSRGIELHAWVENFLVDLPIAEKKPEWMNVNRKGDTYYLENGVTKYYFMNPALPQVRDFLSELYRELVKKYKIDGIQFDYLRYPNSGDYTNDFGYDAYTRQLFMNYSDADPIAIKPEDPLWHKWCEFREYTVSSYAYRVFSELKSLQPKIHISADVWPDYDDTLADIYQNPKAWSNRDYINTLIPMSYYLHEKPVVDDIVNSWAFARGHSELSSGIAAFTKVDTKVLIKQIEAIRAANTNGVAIFEYESLFNNAYADALKLGAFSTPSAATSKNPEQSIKAVLEDIVRKLNDIYLKNNGIDNKQRNKYKNLIEKIKVSLNEYDIEAAYSLKDNIQEIMKILSYDENINEEISKRISVDLNRALNIIDGYISNARFMVSHTVKEFQVELPLMDLAGNQAIPFKIKAIFNDNTVMYLDETQYAIDSGNSNSAEMNGQVTITIDILDSFKYNTAKDLNKRIEFTMEQNGKAVVKNSAQATLRASETGYKNTRLDWGSTVINSDIVGYVIYRNSQEILRTSSNFFKDSDLHSGETYTYEVHGFDVAGNIVFRSNKITIKTRDLPLLSSR
jgi:uncharacterized lipoprotein YddW (UPF0748 family)